MESLDGDLVPTTIETTSYTLTVYSGKEEVERLDDPVPLGGGKELVVELAKAGLTLTGRTDSSALGMFVEAKDAGGNIVRVKVAPK